MPYTQLKLKPEYREKLATLADPQHRSMANMVELLIDRELEALEKQVAAEITAERRLNEPWREDQSLINHQDLERMRQNLKRRLDEWDGKR